MSISDALTEAVTIGNPKTTGIMSNCFVLSIFAGRCVLSLGITDFLEQYVTYHMVMWYFYDLRKMLDSVKTRHTAKNQNSYTATNMEVVATAGQHIHSICIFLVFTCFSNKKTNAAVTQTASSSRLL